MLAQDIDPQVISLGKYGPAIDSKVTELDGKDFIARFWQKDPTLWGGDAQRQSDVASMLGWIDALPKLEERLSEVDAFVSEIQGAGFTRVILAGMGGSSLAPLVFSLCYPLGQGGLPLDVLDSTDPETILDIERKGDLATTLVIIASKSGTTAEPNAFEAYLYEKIGKPENFVAITDPDSPFAAHASERGYRKIFLNYPDIGGRFSALSMFGLVPAALMGHPVREIIRRAGDIARANNPGARIYDAPAFYLGVVLGELAREGRDKVTFLSTEHFSCLGLWMEQLLAESTGKQGTGVLPVVGEPAGTMDVYGPDRVFVVFRPAVEDTAELEETIQMLQEIQHPVIVIGLEGPYAIAQEMFRFEIATAVIGAILDINPFDQPNVQESKDITKRILKTVEEEGKLPDVTVSVVDGDLSVYGEDCGDDITDSLRIFLGEPGPNDYVTLMAYLHETNELTSALHEFQKTIRDRTHLATTTGFGPRFLHSTGQFHKGGPATGLYIQLTGDHREDAPIPGQKATWGAFIDAQAAGDYEALKSKDRRILRIHIAGDPVEGIKKLTNAMSAI